MNTLKSAYRAEIKAFLHERAKQDAADASHHLEHAHILSQQILRFRLHAHAVMLTCAISRREWREVHGQVLRLIFAAIGALLGWTPMENTGRASVSASRSIPNSPCFVRQNERQTISVSLSIPRKAGSRCAMRARFFPMLLMFAILFGNLVAPEAAHAGNIQSGHSIEILEVHDHAETDDLKEPQNDSSPGHAMVHHHCSIAITVETGGASLIDWNAKAAVTPLIVRPMASLALAPPTEPPAA